MPNILQCLLARDWLPGRAAAASVAATAAYSVAMEIDKYLTDNHFNDVTFIQGMLGDPDGSSRETAALAWGLHFLNGVMLAEIYAALVKRFLPGPDWLKGTIFGAAFIAAAWPLTPLVDRCHPMIQSGRLPRLANWTSFWQNVLRHLVFGLTLGLLYRSRGK